MLLFLPKYESGGSITPRLRRPCNRLCTLFVKTPYNPLSCRYSAVWYTIPGPLKRMRTGRLVRPAEPMEGLKNLGGASSNVMCITCSQGHGWNRVSWSANCILWWHIMPILSHLYLLYSVGPVFTIDIEFSNQINMISKDKWFHTGPSEPNRLGGGQILPIS